MESEDIFNFVRITEGSRDGAAAFMRRRCGAEGRAGAHCWIEGGPAEEWDEEWEEGQDL